MNYSLISRSLLAAAFSVMLASAAYALDLQSARTSGVLGEGNDGYVVVLVPSAQASDLAAQVNAGRKAEYSRISAANGQPVNVVGKVAAETIINKLSAGSKYQDNAGNWKSK